MIKIGIIFYRGGSRDSVVWGHKTKPQQRRSALTWHRLDGPAERYRDENRIIYSYWFCDGKISRKEVVQRMEAHMEI